MIGTCVVVKVNKRLHIRSVETGEIIYTPPDFVRVPHREAMGDLARVFTEKKTRDIAAIIEFEARWTKRSKT